MSIEITSPQQRKEQVIMNDGVTITDQADGLTKAFKRNGWSDEQIKRLSEGNFLGSVLDVLLGRAEIKPVEHIVDFGADPFLLDSWEVEEHQRGKVAKLERKGDDLYLDSKKIEFWQSSGQMVGVPGEILRARLTRLKGKPVLNANLLEHLLKYPNLIPEKWKEDGDGKIRYIFFWGTVYCKSDGILFVRCLSWDGVRWCWKSCSLVSDFNEGNFAAVLEN